MKNNHFKNNSFDSNFPFPDTIFMEFIVVYFYDEGSSLSCFHEKKRKDYMRTR